jgi:hypothetical protein
VHQVNPHPSTTVFENHYQHALLELARSTRAMRLRVIDLIRLDAVDGYCSKRLKLTPVTLENWDALLN